MKAIRRFYRNNRIYCILMLFSLVCLGIMGYVLGDYFVNQFKGDVYGERLYDIEKYDFEAEKKIIEEFFKTNKKVKDVKVTITGKIFYVMIDTDPTFSNEEIQTLCTTSLEKMTPETLKYIDLQYIVRREGFVPYTGSKSSINTVISWSNYKFEKEEKTA